MGPCIYFQIWLQDIDTSCLDYQKAKLKALIKHIIIMTRVRSIKSHSHRDHRNQIQSDF